MQKYQDIFNSINSFPSRPSLPSIMIVLIFFKILPKCDITRSFITIWFRIRDMNHRLLLGHHLIMLQVNALHILKYTVFKCLSCLFPPGFFCLLETTPSLILGFCFVFLEHGIVLSLAAQVIAIGLYYLFSWLYCRKEILGRGYWSWARCLIIESRGHLRVHSPLLVGQLNVLSPVLREHG